MKIRSLAAIGFFAASIAGPALAFNELFADDTAFAKLQDDDIKIASRVIRDALDKGPDDQTQTWSNPKTHASGTVKPSKLFEMKGMQCRKVEFTTSAGGRSGNSRWKICKTDKGWKIAGGA
jgi:surface antigen